MSKHPKAPVQVTSTAARPWKYVEGERPHQVIVEERQDRKNRLMLRWWQPASRSTGAGDVEEARASGQWKKVFLANPHPRSVRTAEQAVDRAAEIRARQVALTVYLALLEGRDPMGVLSPLTEVPGRVQADAAMTPTVIPAPRPVHGLAVSREAPSTVVADAPSPARSASAR